MRVTPRQQEKTRCDLLKYAGQLIQRRGFKNLGVRDLTKKCGISVGTYYNYFPTKEHIIFALADDCLQEIAENRLKKEKAWKKHSISQVFIEILELHFEAYTGRESLLAEFINLLTDPSFLIASHDQPSSPSIEKKVREYKEVLWHLIGSYAKDPLKHLGKDQDTLLKELLWYNYMCVITFWLHDESVGKREARDYARLVAKILFKG